MCASELRMTPYLGIQLESTFTTSNSVAQMSFDKSASG
jgi:hypothetical protein